MTQTDARIDHLPPSTRRQAMAVFAVALTLRLVFCFIVVRWIDLGVGPRYPDFVTSTDGYVVLAETIVDHHRFSFGPDAPISTYRAPGFPAVVAAVYWLIGDIAMAVLLVNCLASAATCVVVYLLAARLLSREHAWLYAAPAVVFPLSIYYCAQSFSDTVYAFTVVAYVASLVWLVRTPTARIAMVTGLTFAACILTKAVLLPFPIIVLAYAAWRQRALLKPLAIAAVVGFSLTGIWTARNHAVSGHWIPVSGGAGYNLLVGNFMLDHSENCDVSYRSGLRRAMDHMRRVYDPQLNHAQLFTGQYPDVPMAIDRAFSQAARDMFVADPMLLPRKLAINAWRFWFFSSTATRSWLNAAVNVPLVCLAAICLIRRARSETTAQVMILLVVCFVGLYAVIVVHSSRFCLPLLMLLIPCAASTIAAWGSPWWAQRCERTRASQRQSPAASRQPGDDRPVE